MRERERERHICHTYIDYRIVHVYIYIYIYM